MERDCESELSKLNIEQNACIYHFGASVIHGQRSNILRLLPLWVLVNTLTIGTISVFYSHLEQQDQNNIGRFFSLKPDELKTILQVLTLYRNACAHDERLYNVWS